MYYRDAVASTEATSRRAGNPQCTLPPVAVLAAAVCVTAHLVHAITNIHTSFAGDPRTEVYVSWRGASTDVVEYGTTPSLGEALSGTSFTSAGGAQHHAKLTGLTPGTRYYYRCGGTTDGGTFRTAPAPSASFTFTAIGDPQQTSERASNLAVSQWITSTGFDFWLCMGDFVQEGCIQAEWDNGFFHNFSAATRASALMPVVGNHDSYSCSNTSWPDLEFDMFRTPYSEGSGYEGWYSFEYGDALFVVLNSNRNQSAQTPWLRSVLQSTTKKWKFAFAHACAYSTGGHPSSLRSGGTAVWASILEENRVNAVFGGHGHTYEITWPISGTGADGSAGQRMSSYAEGTLYYNTPDGGGGSSSSHYLEADWFTRDKADDYAAPIHPVVTVGLDTVTVRTVNISTGAVESEVVLPARTGTVRATLGDRRSSAQAWGVALTPGAHTALTMTLPQSGRFTLTVVDLGGRQATPVIDGEFAAGTHTVALPTLPTSASGVHVLRASLGGQTRELLCPVVRR